MALSDRRLPKNLRVGNGVFVSSAHIVVDKERSTNGRVGGGYFESVVLQAATSHWKQSVNRGEKNDTDKTHWKKLDIYGTPPCFGWMWPGGTGGWLHDKILKLLNEKVLYSQLWTTKPLYGSYILIIWNIFDKGNIDLHHFYKLYNSDCKWCVIM